MNPKLTELHIEIRDRRIPNPGCFCDSLFLRPDGTAFFIFTKADSALDIQMMGDSEARKSCKWRAFNFNNIGSKKCAKSLLVIINKKI